MLKNVIVEDLKYDNLANAVKAKYPAVKFSAKDLETIEKLKPASKQVLTFELWNINTALANGWRRIMKDEILFPHLTVNTYDIKSDDAFCQRQTDYIQNRVWLIPTNWIPKQDEPIELHLKVENKSSEPLTVTSGHIEAETKSPLKWNHRIEIIQLGAGKFIEMKLRVEWGIDLTHGGFSKTGPIIYRPLEFKEPYPESYSVHPKAYKLGVTVNSELIDPMALTLLAWTTMHQKLTKTLESILLWQKEGAKIPYLNPALKIRKVKGERWVYEFMNETYTLANLVSWYTYQQDTSIKYIHPGDDHPEDPSKLVKINHIDHSKLIMAGIEAAMKDVSKIIEAFKKNTSKIYE